MEVHGGFGDADSYVVVWISPKVVRAVKGDGSGLR